MDIFVRLRLLGHFWLSWFGSLMQICSSQERATMPGLLDPAELDRLREVPSAEFDSLFVKLMTVHHAGAVKMPTTSFEPASTPVYAPWRMPFVTSNRARSR